MSQLPGSESPDTTKGAFASVLPLLLVAFIVLTPVCYALMERSGEGFTYDFGGAMGAALAAVFIVVLPIALRVRRRGSSTR